MCGPYIRFVYRSGGVRALVLPETLLVCMSMDVCSVCVRACVYECLLAFCVIERLSVLHIFDFT